MSFLLLRFCFCELCIIRGEQQQEEEGREDASKREGRVLCMGYLVAAAAAAFGRGPTEMHLENASWEGKSLENVSIHCGLHVLFSAASILLKMKSCCGRKEPLHYDGPLASPCDPRTDGGDSTYCLSTCSGFHARARKSSS